MSIEIKFNFTEASEAAAFLVSVQNIGRHAGGEPGLALESGEFIPAAELVKPEKPKAEKKAEAAPKAVAAPTPAPEPEATTSTASSVAYPTLQKAVFALAGKSREAAAAVAASFGVKTFKELPETKWGDALAAVNAKLADLEAA